MFLLLPIRTDSRLRSVPWANWLLIAANCLCAFIEANTQTDFFRSWALNSQRPEMHQFVSYAFMHDGIWHLGGNMLFLYIFGNNICDRLGNIPYLLFYFAGAIFSGFGYAALNATGLVVGASGAVAAVTGAYLALLPRSRITLFYWLFILIGFQEIPSLWFIGVFFLQDVFFSFSRNTGVAHIAHVSGSVFGFVLSLILLKTKLLPRDHFDMLALLDRWNRRRQYQQVVNKGYDPFGYVPKQSGARSPTDAKLEKIQDTRAQISESLARGDLPGAAQSYIALQTLDPTQTMSRNTQLEIANHFFSTQQYPHAAAAYELFLKSYSSGDQVGQVCLMLGLTYARYLNQRDRARTYLQQAVLKLPMNRERELAAAELEQLGNDSPL